MYSAFRSLIEAAPPPQCIRVGASRFFATDSVSVSRQKWRLQGLPAPQSILDDHDTPIDLTEDDEAVNGVRPNTPPLHRRRPLGKPTPHEFARHRQVMKEEFPGGWQPPRKLSREAMDGLRQLHRYDRNIFSTPVLSEKFKISPEAVRRILKSKWEPSKEQRIRLAERDRRKKEERITLKDASERKETQSLTELRKMARRHDTGAFSADDWDGHARGIDSKDKLTFE